MTPLNDQITTMHNLSWTLDEVIEPNTLEDIYKSWCNEHSINSKKYSIAYWCQLIGEDYDYRIKATILENNRKNIVAFSLKSSILETNQDEKAYSISIIHIRPEFFNYISNKINQTKGLFEYQEMVMTSTTNGNTNDFITIKFALPNYEICKIETPKAPRCNENENEIKNKNYKTFSSQIVGLNQTRNHVRYEQISQSPEILSEPKPVFEPELLSLSPSPFLSPSISSLSPNKYNFENDLINWDIIKYTPPSIMIRPNDNSCYFNKPSSIDTQGLYYREIYFDKKNKGYWVNSHSKIAEILMLNQNHFKHNNNSSQIQAKNLYSSSNTNTISKTNTNTNTNTNSNTKSKGFISLKDDLNNWFILKETNKTLLICPNALSYYSNKPNMIYADGLYHRPIYNSNPNNVDNGKNGYWINKNSKLGKIILKNTYETNE